LTRKFIIRLLTVLFFFLPAYALAGSFKVVPIKLFLDARTKTSVLKVTYGEGYSPARRKGMEPGRGGKGQV
jgi:hypothetical protein